MSGRALYSLATTLSRHPASRTTRSTTATVIVTCCGRLCLLPQEDQLSTVLAGQAVGIKEVDDGIWLVSFMDYDLGYIDLEERTLQPLDNPFGARLSPMS